MSTDVGPVKIARPFHGLIDSRYSAIPALSVDAFHASEIFDAVTPVTRRFVGVDGATPSGSVTTVSWLLYALRPNLSIATTYR